MNDILQKVMTFINENTYLLIIICVFLILVLIGYLIDNSVKSKRVRKDIKNKDQVPENIKNEIIKDAMNENKEKMMENSFHNAVREENSENKLEKIDLDNKKSDFEKTAKMELNLDEVSKQEDLNTSLNLDGEDISSQFSLDSNTSINENKEDDLISEPLILNLDDSVTMSQDGNLTSNDSQSILSEPFVLDSKDVISNFDMPVPEDINEAVEVSTVTDINDNNDPDLNIMAKKSSNTKYKNNKKLSEILLNVDKERVNSVNKEDITNIEESKTEENNNLENSKVDIQIEQDSSDELDKIMKKLSSMNNEEDNYTNIF